MARNVYRYQFADGIDLLEAEETLLLAILAVESLHGPSHVRMDARYLIDTEKRACVIDADSAVGRDLTRIFTGYASREFGDDRFTVRRVETAEREPASQAA